MSACINPMSVLITKEGDMGENSTSNDATRQWRQFAGSCCKLWSHVWNKDPLTFEIDGLFELRSMLWAKKKEDTTLKIFFLLFFLNNFFLPDMYLLSKHSLTGFFPYYTSYSASSSSTGFEQSFSQGTKHQHYCLTSFPPMFHDFKGVVFIWWIYSIDWIISI